jgi:hypothetical protein
MINNLHFALKFSHNHHFYLYYQSVKQVARRLTETDSRLYLV